MSSKSRAVFLTFSLTGNTRYVAEQIGKGLIECGFDVIHFDAVQICRALHLGETYSATHKLPDLCDAFLEKIEILSKLKDAIRSSKFFGIGSMSWGSNPAPGFVVLLEKVLSPNLFGNLRNFCVYCTYGVLSPETPAVFANILKKKNSGAMYFGSVSLRCPENGPYLQPFKPEYECMSAKELKKLDGFVKQMTDVFSGVRICKGPGSRRTYPTIPPPVPDHTSRAHLSRQAFSREKGGHPLLNKERCVRCGLCVRSCPYNVIVIEKKKGAGAETAVEGREVKSEEKEKEKEKGSKDESKERKTCNDIGDIEEGYPVWMDAYERDWGRREDIDYSGSQCWACGRCYNLCPKEAIEMSAKLGNRTRYKGPVFLRNQNTTTTPSSSSSSPPTPSAPFPSPTLPSSTVLRPMQSVVFILPRLFGLNTKKTQALYWGALALLGVCVLAVVVWRR